MFIREKTSPTTKNKYLQIVRSYRDNEGKPRHKVIASLGNIKKLNETGELKPVIEALSRYCGKVSPVLTNDVQETRRVIYGPVAVYRKIWEKWNVGAILRKIQRKKTRLKIDLEKSTFLMMVQHLTKPMSKLGVFNSLNRLYGEYELILQHLYRTLEVIADNKEWIEEELFFHRRDLFNNSIDVVFYDATTLYFESQKEGGIRKYGFSKDGKFNDVQVILAMLVDKEGSPIGFNVFEGNKFEGHTLEKALVDLKKRFRLERVIIVADRAMFSQKNITGVIASGYEFILAARLRNFPCELKDKVRDRSNYRSLEIEGEEILYYETCYKEFRLICTWTERRARKDAYDRKRAVEKIEERISNGALSFITKSTYKQFLKVEGEKVSLNKEKIAEDEKWDGFYGIITNNKDLPSFEVTRQYGNLWRIEQSFRIMKSHLEARPMFHWTERRIKGHLMICFIAFLHYRFLELALRKKGLIFSPERIRSCLNEVQISELDIEGRKFLLRSKIEAEANSIFRTFSIAIPPSLQQGSLP